ncbi:MAG: tRNA pseudouridine(38-40) synthase TruA [Clostridia bacterium]|nr:tRNA pseudouridine(38-40) synthase TruA [Clostridia bacterium]
MSKRILLEVAYDGTNYHGWQLQPNASSIEAVLNEHLSALLKEDIKVIGASRTDAGVHAKGNIAVFDTNARIPAEKISYALNQRLPEDIVIRQSREVDPDFHPRRQKSVKHYSYQIWHDRFPMPIGQNYMLFLYIPLDIDKMQQAASYLIGEHDFTSFCSIHTEVVDKVRTILSITVEEQDSVLKIDVTGTGFLYNMVRIIAGTLLEVGKGTYPPEHLKEILEARDRALAGPTVPAKGLTLVSYSFERM